MNAIFENDKTVAKIVRTTSPDNPKNQIVLWVVQWVRGEAPVLEKRRVYNNPRTGKLSTYKLCGFFVEDVEFIREHRKEIEEALRS